MGEHQDVHGVIGNLFQWRVDIPVNIYSIGDFLKGEERNSDWQGDSGPVHLRHPQSRKQTVQVIDKEIGVFEISQQPDIHHDGDGGEPSFPLQAGPVDIFYQVEIGQDRSEDDKDKIGGAPGIKEDAGDEQPQVPQFVGQQEVDAQENRQEIKKE